MTKKNIKRKGNTYYWIKTEGYHSVYSPFYYNGESWKVEINDRTCFISDYKLELLFGKGCIDRMVDLEKDSTQFTVGDIENTVELDNNLRYMYVTSDSNNGSYTVFNFITLYNTMFHNGMMIINKEWKTFGILSYT
jgi:hypothetical protein